MNTIVKTEQWTYSLMQEQLPAESRYELRNHYLIEMPSPKPKHQRIVTNVYDSLKPRTKSEFGQLFIAPLDIVFDEGDSVQPDLIFISQANKHIIKESHIGGVPDLLVEVVSKGSVARDYIEKKNDFEKFGVKEYWIIDSLNETIWVYALSEAGKYELFSYAEANATAHSKLLLGFEIVHQTIFEE